MWGTIGFDWTNQYKFCFRASSIQSRVSELRTLLFGEVIQKLISKSYIEESSTLTKKKEIVTEIRLIETNPIFKHVQECCNWIESRQVCQIFVWSSTLQNIVLDKDFGNYETKILVYFQKSLENAEYGGDVDTVQSLAEEHEQFHREVLSFRKEVDRCIADGVGAQ